MRKLILFSLLCTLPALGMGPNQDATRDLVRATDANDLAGVRSALDQGADVNGESYSVYEFPLLIAVKQGSYEIAKLLIKRGADVNKANKPTMSGFETTPLFIAARRGDVKIVKLLLDNGADASFKSDNGIDAFMEAEEQGRNEVIQLLEQYKNLQSHVKGVFIPQ